MTSAAASAGPLKLLMVSPHFPPDTSAGSHRVRLLAPHLEDYGWTPTVLTVREESYEGRLDRGLSGLVPTSLRVERCAAISPRITRALGFGDLGLRAFPGLFRAAKRILSRDPHHAIFITIYPSYPALLGPMLKKQFGIPFILDYQDPWVGEWGASVGGGKGGRPDLRSRISRRLAMVQEPRAVLAADAITAVSRMTYEGVVRRIPAAMDTPFETLPIGGEPLDFAFARAHPRPNPIFDSGDGRFHLCCVGTVLPLGIETLRAVLMALATVRRTRADIYSRLRLHFVGTSNQTTGGTMRVLPHARELGVLDAVSEHPARIDYLDALTVQLQSSALLLMGSTEHHYTASKLYPALLAGPPILAAYHQLSSVSEILRPAIDDRTRLVEYDDAERAASRVPDIASHIISLVEMRPDQHHPRTTDFERYSAAAIAGRLASVLNRARAGR